MNKTLLMCATFATAGLMAASCSSELDQPTAEGGDGYVTITARMPENFKTRGFSDGEKAQTLHYAVYDAGTNTVIFSSKNQGDPVASYNGDKTFSLGLQLVKGRSYDFLFWADCGEGAPYSFSAKNQEVTINYNNLTGNDENRDAFFNVEKNYTVTGASQKSIQLYRPFGQLNIGTDDLKAAEDANVTLGQIQVTVSDVYNKLNLMTGVASAAEGFDGSSLTYAWAPRPSGETFPHTGTVNGATKTYDYLSMNYVLTGNVIIGGDVNQAQKETKDVTIEIRDKNRRAVNTINVSAVPFQRNYRTNIYGSLLTSSVDYTIEIVPDFNEPDHDFEVTDYNMLKNALESDATEITVPAGAALAIPENIEPLALPDGKKLVVNGTIVGPKSGSIFTVPAGNEVTIEGKGTIEFNSTYVTSQQGDDNFRIKGIDVNGKLNMKGVSMTADNQIAGVCLNLQPNAEATLEDVSINTGFRAIQALSGSKLTVNGGEFHSTSNNTVRDPGGFQAYTYCIVVAGQNTVANFNGTKVTGIQGGVAVQDKAVGYFDNCDISTHTLNGNANTAWHALYSANTANIIVKSGRYYAPTHHAVVLGNNDITGNAYGEATLQGGIFSSIAHSNKTNKDVELAEGYEWADNTDPATKDRYPYTIVKK